MRRYRFRRAVWIGLLALTLVRAGLWHPEAQSQPSSRRPYIVMIVADDLGFSDLGAYGGEIHTPNLDRLAAGGMRFTQFYNNAVCVVTRASMMTGLYPRFGRDGFLRNNM